MTDFTNYDYFTLRKMLSGLLCETTAPIFSPDNPEKVVAEPVYKTGIGFDTESTTITHTVKDKNGKEKTVVDYCFLYTYQIAVGTEYYAVYRTFDQFIMFIKALAQTLALKRQTDIDNGYIPAKCLIWVANLAHEWSFIKYRITEHFEIEKCFAKTPRDVLYVDFGDFVFRECLGLFGHSLADIAKNWTTTQKLKGDLDYDLIRTPETPLTEKEMQYCINDVIILGEMHTAVLKAYTQDNGGVILPNTSSGFVRLELKNSIRNSDDVTDERENYNVSHETKKDIKTNLAFLMHEHRKLFSSPFQWSVCREYGYCGGLCGSNIDDVGITLHDIQCVDLTSDYPAQMLQRKFPSGRLTKIPLYELEKIKRQKRPFFMIGIIKKMDSFTHHATFSVHKALNYKNPVFIKRYGNIKNMIKYNGKIRRAENVIVCVNDVDLAAYSEIYDYEITPLAIYAFTRYEKIPQWLHDCIVHNYITKSKLKIAGLQKTIEYMDSKRNVNTFYGVLSTRPGDMFDNFINGIFEPSEKWSYESMIHQSWLNPYIAFWVTSYARKILMDFISQYPDLIVQYDTDSLYYKTDKPTSKQMETAIKEYNSRIEEKNKKLFAYHPDKALLLSLGTWDFETKYVNFLPLGAKKYIKQDIKDGIQTVIAGLPKTAIPAEIANKNIKRPFSYYNVLKKYIDSQETINAVVVKHQFAQKFASAYNDDCIVSRETIVDYLGKPAVVDQTCYHAIVPIDFTLALGWDYARQIVRLRQNPGN